MRAQMAYVSSWPVVDWIPSRSSVLDHRCGSDEILLEDRFPQSRRCYPPRPVRHESAPQPGSADGGRAGDAAGARALASGEGPRIAAPVPPPGGGGLDPIQAQFGNATLVGA